MSAWKSSLPRDVILIFCALFFIIYRGSDRYQASDALIDLYALAVFSAALQGWPLQCLLYISLTCISVVIHSFIPLLN